MAKKSKGFGESLNQKYAQSQKKAMAKMKQRLLNSPLSNITDVVVNPKGTAKMSEVLGEFISPYRHLAKNRNAYESLLAIAILAWNVAILPEDQEQKLIDEALQQVVKLDFLVKQDVKSFLNALIARKKNYFADNKRYIMDFQLQEIGNRYHLSVASTSME